jgi:hypothetical protein
MLNSDVLNDAGLSRFARSNVEEGESSDTDQREQSYLSVSRPLLDAIVNCGKRSKAKPWAWRAPNPETTETGFSLVKLID